MTDKFRRKKQISPKAITFWSVMALIVLVLIVLLIVRVSQTREVSSYNNLEMISGEDLFSIKEDKYLVLVYDFKGEKEYETFDKGMYKYLTYCRDNSKYTLIMGMDSTKASNRKCFTDGSETINGAKQFPNALNTGSSDVLKINEGDLPILLVIESNEVTAHKTGENEILSYLRDVMANK